MLLRHERPESEQRGDTVKVLAKGIIAVAPAEAGDRGRTSRRATALAHVANRPIICHVLDALSAAGLDEIAVLAPEELADELASCIDADGGSQQELCYVAYDGVGSQDRALEEVVAFAGDAPTIVHRADGILGQPLGPFLDLIEDDCPDMVMLVTEGARNAERLGPAAQQVLRVTEFDPVSPALGVAGVCVLGAGAFGDPGAMCISERGLDVGALVESRIAHDSNRIQVRVVREWHAFTGDALDLLDMNRAVLEGLDAHTPLLQDDGNRFEGRVYIDPTATVVSSVICGPAIVGPEAHVADSYIGPHTSIGAGAHIEGAEIERSIVLERASIIHVGGRLVASVVGRDARVVRDFSVPRAMRLRVGDGDEVVLC